MAEVIQLSAEPVGRAQIPFIDGLAAATKMVEEVAIKEEKERSPIRVEHDYVPAVTKASISAKGATLVKRNQIMVLAASPGMGKTMVVEALCAGLLASTYGKSDVDSLGFEFDREDTRDTIWIDLERDKDECSESMQRLIQRLELPNTTEFRLNQGPNKGNIKGFEFLSAAHIDKVDVRWNAIYKAVEERPVKAIVLDGGLMLVKDFNDIEQCSEAISRLRAIAIDHNLTIVLTLHTNKKSRDDVQGHMGGIAYKYARAMGMIMPLKSIKGYDGYADGERVVCFDSTIIDQAKSSYSGGAMLPFKWDYDLHMMASIDIEEPALSSPRGGHQPFDFSPEFFQKVWAAELALNGKIHSYKAKELLMKESNKGQTVVRDAISKGINQGFITSEGEGKSTYYSLKNLIRLDDEIPF